MITIQNVGPYDDPDYAGWRKYEIRINNRLVTTFTHKRSEGLVTCLQKASEAVGQSSWKGRFDK